ncbi:hypothetical protein D9613_004648 [Agrocybe pediades]|uniref:F-box domain-containing protein n=1 Tax=Agrocybe pediades TaxID=84607 RepID=A0A8H4VQL6_9AGAR|nr:hypothetical protein D9613_004648 [Agrocybe pediades]
MHSSPRMPTCTTLNPDILWTIFTHVAADYEEPMDDRLACILHASLVCRSWRPIILPATTIWSRLVYVDSDRPGSRRSTLDLLKLVVERWGAGSRLCIEATREIGRPIDLDARSFLSDAIVGE